ncbi:hypothetical protein BDV35DRAFT_66011 [Aspergillus flavus]|uniref:Uncharacterized protein n=1 Tax=Aspergillus flavus TaxID=5059 RepID=A0A5N6H8J5_ASPFL|nr:hypothetical protein BDV35DRAFT_66011 [Aspergillus flavus]
MAPNGPQTREMPKRKDQCGRTSLVTWSARLALMGKNVRSLAKLSLAIFILTSSPALFVLSLCL